MNANQSTEVVEGSPRVTVVVATYRAGDYLRQAIRSALAQTFSDLEIVVSDDAADPSVRELVEAFGDPRVRYRSNSTRLGPAKNHWAAFAMARGQFLAILNHDDLWQPSFLTVAVQALDQSPAAVLVFCDHEVIGLDGKPIPGEADQLARQWGRDRLLLGTHQPFPGLVTRQSIPLAMGCVFRRAAIDPGTLPDVGPAYDLWLAYALCRTGGAAIYIPGRLTAWRVHPSQLTGTRDEGWIRGGIACWEAMALDPLFRPFRATVRRKLSIGAATLAVARLHLGDRTEARAAAWLAARIWPFNWRAWAAAGLAMLPLGLARRVLKKSIPNRRPISN